MKKMISVVLLSVAVAGCTGNGLSMKDSKRAVCHKGKTIYVDGAAFDAHIRHGDYGRACYGEQKKGQDKHGRDGDEHDDRD